MANRPSASYQPSTWTCDFVESFQTGQTEIYKERQRKLEEEVRKMVDDEDVEVEPTALLELVDIIQRLGLGYIFDRDIKRALHRIKSVQAKSNDRKQKSLHATALSFRLLRQHGYQVSQDIFKHFMDDNGKFKACHCNDGKGMLSLHEASYLGFEGENILDDAKSFIGIHLRHHLGKINIIDPSLAEQVSHALELPLHRRMLRLEAREYIEAYARRVDANHVLLELAVLDFNMVQSTHLSELQDMSRWWRYMGLANKLSFTRDRIVESFFCSIGMVFEPQFSNFRKGMTKLIALIIIIDDVYDMYGSLKELEQFTEAIERWSMDAIENLSDCLKLCFQALYSTVNEMAYDNFKEQGVNTISQLKKAWADLCKAFLVEAKWYHTKATPKFKDYMDNAWLSSSAVVILVHAYCLIDQNITKQALDCFDQHNDLFYHPSMIFRLCNDLASSLADLKGEITAKSIPCYMNETKLSEELACEQMRNLIDETWKKMNKGLASNNTPFSRPLMDIILNLVRTIHCIYQYGDAYGAPDNKSKIRVLKLLFEPVSLIKE
ncbi:unnamed protein product [Camellia sinensis]